MKTFKKALVVVMCIVMVLSAAPLSAFVGIDLPNLFDFKAEAATYSGECGAEGNNLTWTFNTGTGVLTINGTGAMADYASQSSVPWYLGTN